MSIISGSGIARQIALEQESIASGRAKFLRDSQKALDKGRLDKHPPVQRMMREWYEYLKAYIDAEKDSIKKADPKAMRPVGVDWYGPVLMALPSSKIAAATCIAATATLMHSKVMVEGTTYRKVANAVGRAVLAEYAALALKKRKEKAGDHDASYFRIALRKFLKKSAPKAVLKMAKNKEGGLVNEKIVYSTGGFLLGLLTKFVASHVFKVEMHRTGKRQTRWVWIDHNAQAEIGKDIHAIAKLRPARLPMVCPPLPTTDTRTGGRMLHRRPAIVRATSWQRMTFSEAPKELHDAINYMQCDNPMRVNRVVLDTAWALQAAGGGGPLPSLTPTSMPEYEGDDEAGLRQHKAKLVMMYRENVALASKQLDTAEALELARRFSGEDALWFDVFMCYRGRMYCAPETLNYQSFDLARALLEFSDPVELGPDGLRWLFISAAIWYGHDKIPFQDRVEWAEANLREILLTAKDPLATDWWHAADEPWQFLAACVAINDIHTHGVRARVTVDGVCNGLQHYAAMTRDETIAPYLGMTKQNAPPSLYRRVADLVRPQIDADMLDHTTKIRHWRNGAEYDVPISTIASQCDGVMTGKVAEKVCKPPTMTWTYGVTPYGAKRQVGEALVEYAKMPEEKAREVASYLSWRVLKTLPQVTPRAHLAMEWLQRMADEHANDGQTVRYIGADGFPVEQRYRTHRQMVVRTISGAITLKAFNETDPPSKHKQARCIAATTVHSLDAVMRNKVTMKCMRDGIGLTHRHDAFETHAGRMTRLHGMHIPDAFTEQHAGNVLADLHQQWSKRLGRELEPPPPQGIYEFGDFRQNEYFFH